MDNMAGTQDVCLRCVAFVKGVSSCSATPLKYGVQIYQHLCPAAFQILQEFNELKELIRV